MSSVSSIMRASLSGSVEFLILNGAGALVAHVGHWNDKLGSHLSSSVFKILLPTLVFGPVLRSSHSLYEALFNSTTTASSSSAIQDLTVPFTFSVLLLSLTSFLFTPLLNLITRNKHPFVRALMWACLMLGNTTTLPVVIMKALCASLPPFQSSVAQCSSSVTAYSAIFLIPQIVFTWALAYPYLQCAVMNNNEILLGDTITETSSLLPTTTTTTTTTTTQTVMDANSSLNHNTASSHVAKRASFLSFFYKLCNPPVVTIFFAAMLGMCPIIPDMLVNEDGALYSVLTSLDSLGTLAVSLSAVIVGAEVYNALAPTCSSSSSSISTSPSSISVCPPSESLFISMKQGDLRFGTFGIIAVTVIRLILFPWIARIIFSTIHAKTWFASNPLLGLFVLQQTNLTSASSIQLMVNMIQKQAPFVRVLKKDVAYIILLQFCIAPVFLTLNTALSIALQLS